MSFELRRYSAQVIGGLSSIVAILSEGEEYDPEYPLDVESFTAWALQEALKTKYTSAQDFTERVMHKQARHNRSRTDFKKSE